MGSFDLTFAGGLLFGLLSALHCSAMCSGICANSVMLLNPQTGRDRYIYLSLVQAGRIGVYASLGAFAAFAGSEIVPANDVVAYRVLQWAAALSLIWIGLVVAGMAPRMALIDSGFAALQRGIERASGPVRRHPLPGAVSLGMLWGASACPMVYGAIFSASLTGSALAGALFMLGFGLGTVPAVTLGGAALARLKDIERRGFAASAAGLSIAAAGLLSIYWPWQDILGICVTPQ